MASLSCPSHPNVSLVEDHRAGDVICPECGLVVGDRIVDVGSEWRSFNNEKSCKDPSRVGAPENHLLSGSDLSTSIQRSSDLGIELSTRQRKQANSSDRRMLQAIQIIREMADRIHLPKAIQDKANENFKKVADAQSFRGRSTEAVAAACLYIGCRQEGVPRTFKEICAISKVSKKEIGRCYKLVVRVLETNVDLITSADYMSRFCGNLNLPRYVEAAATSIAKKAVDSGMAGGRSPISVAAAAIYMACQATPDAKLNAKDIGEVTGVAEMTIKTSYKMILPQAAEMFPSNWKYPELIKTLPPP